MPVNAVVHVLVTGADVIHSWTVPSFGSKIDAMPGRMNETWFKATEPGVYFGQCSELCGVNHAYMPIVVEVVEQTGLRHLGHRAEGRERHRAEDAPRGGGLKAARHEELAPVTDLAATIAPRSAPGTAYPGEPGLGDYVRLLKPRVMSLVVFTALAGMVAAPGQLNPVLGFAWLVCIAAGAGAAGALNMWWDADIDRRMSRTARRPIPAGRLDGEEALGLGLGLAILSVADLAVIANLLAAGILAFTIFFYAVVYTMLLKRSTPQNIVIGGAAGAFPPMIGWAAATGGLGRAPVLMFAVIFLWTPPHFWALALYRNGDYARAGVPMMPVVAGEARTRREVLLYTLALSAVALLPAFTVAGGPVYLAVALVAGAVFLRAAWVVSRRTAAIARADRYGAEKRLFGLSILYLFVLFAAFMAEAMAGRVFGPFDWPVWF